MRPVLYIDNQAEVTLMPNDDSMGPGVRVLSIATPSTGNAAVVITPTDARKIIAELAEFATEED